jgi:hypothetical protein
MNVVLLSILQEASSKMGGMSINNKKPGMTIGHLMSGRINVMNWDF